MDNADTNSLDADIAHHMTATDVRTIPAIPLWKKLLFKYCSKQFKFCCK